MKTKCPSCGNEFDAEMHASICPMWVALTQLEKIKRLSNDLRKDNGRGKTASQIQEEIEEHFANELISTNLILTYKNWKNETDGDFLRVILDSFVCKGVCEKMVYKKGKGGSRWRFISPELTRPCEHFQEGECKGRINFRRVEENEVLSKIIS